LIYSSGVFIRLLRQLMPESRFIIIYRDIVDCLRSAKARRSVASEQEARQFCNDWTNNLAFMLGVRNDPSDLWVKYAELVAEPERVIEMLAGFAGIRDMRIQILSHKINARVDGETQMMDQPGYIEPVALTEAEQRMADESASALAMAMRDREGI
jgi:hypothetical protein